MSKSRNNSARSQSHPQPGDCASNPPHQPECHAMSDNVTPPQFSDISHSTDGGSPGGPVNGAALTGRQRSALPEIAASPTIRDAAHNIGVSERTIYRWLEDEDFRAEFTRLRDEVVELSYQELRGLALRIVSVFAEGMEAPDLATRLRAAKYAASHTVQVQEARQIRADIQILEQAFEEWKVRSPLR